MPTFLLDLRLAVRRIRQHPGPSLVVIVTLALGLAIFTSFLSMLYGMVLRPLPFADPEGFLAVHQSRPEEGSFRFSVSPANLLDLREVQGFSALEAYAPGSWDLDGEGRPVRVRGARVTPGLFSLLGVGPALGRGPTAGDVAETDGRVVVLGHDLWQRMGGARSVLGRTVRISGRPHEVIGVMPPGFEFPFNEELWLPLAIDPADASRSQRGLLLVGRARPGVTLEALRADVGALATRLREDFPEIQEGWGFHVLPQRESWLPPVTATATWILQGLVSVVLLLVCANVANIRLADATTRTQEHALRRALGASRWRRSAQALTESVLLAGLGGILGILLVVWNGDWPSRISAIPIPYWLTFELDPPLLAAALTVTLLVGVGLGLLPGLTGESLDLATALRSGGRGDSGTGGSRLRRILVGAEYAMALAVLVAAFLMVRSYQELRHRDPGYRIADVDTARVAFSGPDWEEPSRVHAGLRRALDALEAHPGVARAAVVNRLPSSRDGYLHVRAESEELAASGEGGIASSLQAISSGYFRALEIPLLSGREPASIERGDETALAWVDAGLAERLWPGRTPLGRSLHLDGFEGLPSLRVVGVVGRVDPGEELAGVGSRAAHQVYVPMTCCGSGLGPLTSAPVVVASRRSGSPELDREDWEALVGRVLPTTPIFDVRTMDRVQKEVYFAQHLWGLNFSLIAVVALGIAAVGTYGISAFSVRRRWKELGIRLALGASPGQLRSEVLRRGLRLAAGGLGLGLLVAFPLAGAMRTLLHGVSPRDPGIFLAVAGLLLTVAVVATWFPALRASSIDPSRALREE